MSDWKRPESTLSWVISNHLARRGSTFVQADYTRLFVQPHTLNYCHSGSTPIEGVERIPKCFVKLQTLPETVPRDLHHRLSVVLLRPTGRPVFL